ncbi:MAG: KaiC 1 [Chthoniobacteraceae bacterium]|nr:KaiC 1 [Chthoniobacteraceae bacterium]
MAKRQQKRNELVPLTVSGIRKAPTGVEGFDQITSGGLPQGRPTLICGSAGCGKTLLAMEFLVRGATLFDEPGVFMSFEESSQELVENVRSMGFDLSDLEARKKIVLDFVRIEREEVEETGEYDLEGLFIRLSFAVQSIGAKRVVLDTIEALFAGLPNEMIVRAELRRLFRWLKENGLTAIITGEQGKGTLTRHGLEEYVADCVILLDHRVSKQVTTRRLRIVKYRGSSHGTNEYPFLIGESGISVLPITSLRLEHKAPTARVSSGIASLDEMFSGQGFYRGSSILLSGSPGTGKSSVAASFVDATCRRGERCLLVAYEESSDQIVRNMHSIGIDLGQWIDQGLLRVHATRPTLYGLEMHLWSLRCLVESFNPDVVVVDPLSNLSLSMPTWELKPALMQLIDLLKSRGITALFTSLVSEGSFMEEPHIGISSLMDTLISLRNIEADRERNRILSVIKSRGMTHSNQAREFILSNNGVYLVDIRVVEEKVLIGTARASYEAGERANASLRRQRAERQARQAARKRKAIEARIAAFEAELEAEAELETDEADFLAAQEVVREETQRLPVQLRMGETGELLDQKKIT